LIHDVDESLRALVRRDVADGSDVDVLFDAPTKDWAARRNGPTIDIYLYDIREDLRRRQQGMIGVLDDAGHTVARRQPPRFFKLSYLLTAWTQRPEDEHRLLSGLMTCFLMHDHVPEEVLVGGLADEGLPLGITLAIPPPEDRALSDVWTALGGELKPSLDLVVVVPVDLNRDQKTAPPVTEEPRLTFTRPGGAVEKVGRRMTRPHAEAATDDELVEPFAFVEADQPGRRFGIRPVPRRP
jgi:hypothetical protein